MEKYVCRTQLCKKDYAKEHSNMWNTFKIQQEGNKKHIKKGTNILTPYQRRDTSEKYTEGLLLALHRSYYWQPQGLYGIPGTEPKLAA